MNNEVTIVIYPDSYQLCLHSGVKGALKIDWKQGDVTLSAIVSRTTTEMLAHELLKVAKHMEYCEIKNKSKEELS